PPPPTAATAPGTPPTPKTRPPRPLLRNERQTASPRTNSEHAGTISLTFRGCRASPDVMKPRIQCVLTPWNPGSMASAGVRRRPDSHDQLRLTGYAVLAVLM